ncbi:hypothetical protein GCM10011352_17480 [Marinobacterium zhoushanense]|uniref:Uncharacterized protein n=2 Tax=Marinobacterium zhoushanense TaxID=1679163 RepID=A0ABQ1KAD1_9GAMM|nr:hypothetical protein GCM10011352_17480 [Marinobacterium zhoushanense]
MQQGVVDGTFLPAMDQKFLHIAEDSTDLTLFPKGLYTTAFTILMNPDVFESLSPKDQETIGAWTASKEIDRPHTEHNTYTFNDDGHAECGGIACRPRRYPSRVIH